jgi:hypothetical protein
MDEPLVYLILAVAIKVSISTAGSAGGSGVFDVWKDDRERDLDWGLDLVLRGGFFADGGQGDQAPEVLSLGRPQVPTAEQA